MLVVDWFQAQLTSCGQQTDNTSHLRSKMKWQCFLFMVGTCLAAEYNVGEKTSFYRFEIRPHIKQITASTPTIKTRNCGRMDFCLEVYGGKRAAIVRGIVYKNVSAVIFYSSQRNSPRALVIRMKVQPNHNRTALQLPAGTKVEKAVEVSGGTIFDYLAIFDDDLEKIEVLGDVQVVTTRHSNAGLKVYSPLYLEGAKDAKFLLVNGRIEQKKMSFDVQYTNGQNETFTFNPLSRIPVGSPPGTEIAPLPILRDRW
ncbi:hypothetical protein SprV_0802531300 [Sparganum proliferum]